MWLVIFPFLYPSANFFWLLFYLHKEWTNYLKLQGDPTSPFQGNQPWDFFGRNDAKAETPVLWPPHAKSWLTGEDFDAGRDWGQEEKGTTEDEMAGWHHWLDGCKSEWTPGVGDGQGGLVCCDSWGQKSQTRLSDWTELMLFLVECLFLLLALKKQAAMLGKTKWQGRTDGTLTLASCKGFWPLSSKKTRPSVLKSWNYILSTIYEFRNRPFPTWASNEIRAPSDTLFAALWDCAKGPS